MLPIAEVLPMPDALTKIKEQLSVATRIDEALPQVRGLETEDRDLDNYAKEAMESYQKLMDLGFNVDDRNAGKIFEVASTMMNNAITAKTTKLDKKLKMVELQLRLARLQKDLGKEEPDKPTELNTDRNAILNLINQNLKKQ
jgi:ribosomal protein S17E